MDLESRKLINYEKAVLIDNFKKADELCSAELTIFLGGDIDNTTTI